MGCRPFPLGIIERLRLDERRLAYLSRLACSDGTDSRGTAASRPKHNSVDCEQLLRIGTYYRAAAIRTLLHHPPGA